MVVFCKRPPAMAQAAVQVADEWSFGDRQRIDQVHASAAGHHEHMATRGRHVNTSSTISCFESIHSRHGHCRESTGEPVRVLLKVMVTVPRRAIWGSVRRPAPRRGSCRVVRKDTMLRSVKVPPLSSVYGQISPSRNEGHLETSGSNVEMPEDPSGRLGRRPQRVACVAVAGVSRAR